MVVSKIRLQVDGLWWQEERVVGEEDNGGELEKYLVTLFKGEKGRDRIVVGRGGGSELPEKEAILWK